MRRYRFFFHFNRAKGAMTVHFRGVCHLVDEVICRCTCETKWSKSQPRLVLRGFAYDVQFVYKRGRMTAYIT